MRQVPPSNRPESVESTLAGGWRVWTGFLVNQKLARHGGVVFREVFDGHLLRFVIGETQIAVCPVSGLRPLARLWRMAKAEKLALLAS